jgi:hypothetical protein
MVSITLWYDTKILSFMYPKCHPLLGIQVRERGTFYDQKNS